MASLGFENAGTGVLLDPKAILFNIFYYDNIYFGKKITQYERQCLKIYSRFRRTASSIDFATNSMFNEFSVEI